MYYKENPNNYTRCEKCKHIDRENEECKITNDKWLVSDRAGTCHQYEEVKMLARAKMSVVNDNLKEITQGKIYKYLSLNRDKIRILNNDLGVEKEYSNKMFDVILDFEPAGKIVKDVNTCGKAKQFEESMKKVSEVASKCGFLSDDYWSIEDNRNEYNPIKPNHYKAGSFDVIAFCFEHDLDFATGNIIKYVTRAGKKDKDKTIEDLIKAQEYLDRLIERRRKAND